MSERGTLAAALQRTSYAPGDAALPLSDFAQIIAAARERLAQLPETCPCGGKDVRSAGLSDETRFPGSYPCGNCINGYLYPPALVERIARACVDYVYGERVIEAPSKDDLALAVAVLDALNTETPTPRYRDWTDPNHAIHDDESYFDPDAHNTVEATT